MLLHQAGIRGLLLAFCYLHVWMQLILYSLSRSRQKYGKDLMALSIRGRSSVGGLEARLKGWLLVKFGICVQESFCVKVYL